MCKSDLPEAYQSRWLDDCSDEDNEPLDFQIIHHDLEHGTEEVVFDSARINTTNDSTGNASFHTPLPWCA